MARRGENIYKRKDGRWEARAIKGYSEKGKAIYAYFYGRSYREAKDKMFTSVSYVECNLTQTQSQSEDAICFEVLLDMWLENSKIRLKESSYAKYHNIIRNHIKPSLGKHPLSCITNTELNQFIAEKLNHNKSNAKGLSEKTVKDFLTVIKAALRYAKTESMLANINVNVALPKEKPKDIRILYIDEQTALEKFLCTDMDESKLGIFLCLYTGLRNWRSLRSVVERHFAGRRGAYS